MLRIGKLEPAQHFTIDGCRTQIISKSYHESPKSVAQKYMAKNFPPFLRYWRPVRENLKVTQNEGRVELHIILLYYRGLKKFICVRAYISISMECFLLVGHQLGVRALGWRVKSRTEAKCRAECQGLDVESFSNSLAVEGLSKARRRRCATKVVPKN